MPTRREYRYIGAKAIQDALPSTSARLRVGSAQDIRVWLEHNPQERTTDGGYIVTFIIALDGSLWMNDRRSEHVLCAAGQPVLSAGEMTLQVDRKGVEVMEVTNQSTGYCPEPESWWAVAQALDAAKLPHPDDFTMAYLFRRCERCSTINLIKEGRFRCEVCGEALPEGWNFAA